MEFYHTWTFLRSESVCNFLEPFAIQQIKICLKYYITPSEALHCRRNHPLSFKVKIDHLNHLSHPVVAVLDSNHTGCAPSVLTPGINTTFIGRKNWKFIYYITQLRLLNTGGDKDTCFQTPSDRKKIWKRQTCS